jgi:putative oxidoreductase
MLRQMQRCFTTFPDRWPGVGLVILRLTLAGTLLQQVTQHWSVHWHSFSAALFCIELGCGGLLLLGLWTPIVAGLITLAEAVLFASTYACPHLLAASLGLMVLMLGPGAWSIDSRLFGRRRIHIEVLRTLPRDG